VNALPPWAVFAFVAGAALVIVALALAGPILHP